jgi:hypothetical protein
MYYENKVTKVLFWLPRIAILLYALYPSIEDNEAFALPFYCTILGLFVLFFIGCGYYMIKTPRKALYFLLSSNKKENILDLCLSVFGLCICLYKKEGFPDGTWIILIIGSLLALLPDKTIIKKDERVYRKNHPCG